MLKEIKQNERIKFMDFATEEKIVDIYDSFDVLYPPAYIRVFGPSILEAQPRGLLVVIYKYGKIPKEVRKYCFEAESLEHMAQIIEQLKENGYSGKGKEEGNGLCKELYMEKDCKKDVRSV